MKAVFFAAWMLSASLCTAQTWLSLPANTGYVDVGDLDIPGNQLTIECLYTSTNPGSVDLVSKHSGPPDVNYLLRRTHAEMTTTNGFSSTPSTCPPDENTCRHAAMVYNGATLSFYLNGQLNGQVPMSGNMIQNNFETLIGNYGCCFGGEQFFGFIDEVRFWGIARTQAQIQTFMFIPLPTPTTQTGLLAYYSFSSTINLQGNTFFNGLVAGTASIGNVNPTCSALTPVCVILGASFNRFTASPQASGIQLDWEWNGATPQHFLLETGADPANLTIRQTIEAQETSLLLRGLPMAATWYRLAAVTANGEIIRSNAVQYLPDSGAAGFSALHIREAVRVTATRPMPVTWRIHDLAGRELGRGERFADEVFEIALPQAASGMVLVTVLGGGRQVTVKCLVGQD